MSTTIDTLLDVANSIDSSRMDYKAKTHNLYVNDMGQVSVRDSKPFDYVRGDLTKDVEFPDRPAQMYLTDHALGQIASRLGISYGMAFFKNNKDLPQHLVGDILNHYLEHRDEKDLLIRQFNGNIRGVCGSTYLIMDHAWVLEQVKYFMTAGGGKDVAPHIVVPGWRLEPDYMNVKIVLRPEKTNGDGIYGMGVSVRNGTVANASVGIEALTMRTSCTNSITNRDSKWTVRHVGSTDILAMRESLIIASLSEAFQQSYDLADKMIRSRKQRLPNIFDTIEAIVNGQRLGEDTANIISAGTEGDTSLFGLVNGLTWAAQERNNGGQISRDDAENLEAFAGNMLMKFGDGETQGDILARQLFSMSGSKAHVSVGIDE